MSFVQVTQEPKYWLLGIAAGLMIINLTLISRYAPADFVGTSLLFLGGAAFLIWERYKSFELQSSLPSTILGIGIISLVLMKSATLNTYDIFLRLSPFMSGLGLALLASGIKGIKQYWQELFILGFMSISTGFLLKIFNISPLTAKFAAMILWYLGFPVTHKGIYVSLPTGSIEVYSGCSGYSAILQLLGLSILFLFMFPTTVKQKIYIPFLAGILGFIINGIRVALMGFLVAYSDKDSFEYWHFGEGSLIFSMIGVLLLGVFCWVFILRHESPNTTQK
ncbi:cyanoexosortase A [Laspinema sp. A4]|uniref:cyanoexosortase A n=1 Tax=Laspinema sp. D2d TaxID=2953686 RepID=UPI0021BAA21E|nr:cyanoexosortase A [Laspinema sp. D2d]MCT7983580.1 cyanoexosortase A [Laspinema sp. D2d]